MEFISIVRKVKGSRGNLPTGFVLPNKKAEPSYKFQLSFNHIHFSKISKAFT